LGFDPACPFTDDADLRSLTSGDELEGRCAELERR
jgi:hypothetical protein